MNRRFALIAVCLLGAGLFAASCGKSADQPSAADANSAPSVAESAKTAVKKALEPRPLVVPAETVLSVVLDQTISSTTTNSGEKFSATVETPVEVEGKVAIPKGARAEGIVKEAKAAGRFKGGAVLSLTLSSVTVDGKDYEIETSAPTMASKGKGKRTAAMVGGGAGGGALIGGLAGGGKGAVIGGWIGAQRHRWWGLATRDITLPAEAALNPSCPASENQGNSNKS